MRTVLILGILVALAGCGGDENNQPADSTNGAPNGTPNGSNKIVDPIIIDPCGPLTEMGISDAFGAVATLKTGATPDDNWMECEWTAAVFDFKVANRKQSNAQDYRDSWEGDAASTDITTLDWSPDGELRVVDIEGTPIARLWAYIIDTDPIGRDVWIELTVGPRYDDVTDTYSAPPIDTQKTALLSLGKLLRDEVRDAQPDGVELP